MEIEIGEQIAETLVPGSAKPMHLRLYRARWITGGPELIEHDEVGWFRSEELQGLSWHAADIDLLNALLRRSGTRD